MSEPNGIDYPSMVCELIQRSHQWMDLVMENAAKGDWNQLIEDVGDCLNNVDAVDDDCIELWNRAKARAVADTKRLQENDQLRADKEALLAANRLARRELNKNMPGLALLSLVNALVELGIDPMEDRSEAES